MSNIVLKTEDFIDGDGVPSKKLTVQCGDMRISIALGCAEAKQISAGLHPDGKNVEMRHGVIKDDDYRDGFYHVEAKN